MIETAVAIALLVVGLVAGTFGIAISWTEEDMLGRVLLMTAWSVLAILLLGELTGLAALPPIVT